MSNSPSRPGRSTLQFLRRGVVLLVCVLATAGPTEARAGTEAAVRSASVALDQDVYELEARTSLEIPEDARKAIEAGLTMRVDYEIELNRDRSYWVDKGIASLVQTYELSYHALSQRYLVRNLNTGEQQDYGTFNAAIDRLSEVQGLPVFDAALVEAGRRYSVSVRVVVDLNSSSEALSWILFWTDDWSAKSEWYTWPLRP